MLTTTMMLILALLAPPQAEAPVNGPATEVDPAREVPAAQTDILADLASLGYSLSDGHMIASLPLLDSTVDFVLELPLLEILIDGELAATATVDVTEIGTDWMTVDVSGWTQYQELPAISQLAEGEWLIQSWGPGSVAIGVPSPSSGPMYEIPPNALVQINAPEPIGDMDDGCACAGAGGGKRACLSTECDTDPVQCSPQGAHCRQTQPVCAAGAELSWLAIPLIFGAWRLRKEKMI